MQQFSKKYFLYCHFDNKDMSYGRQHKIDAVKYLKMSQGIDIQKCSLFIDKEMLYLGVAPDGSCG